MLLSGSEGGSRVAADAAGAEAYVPKPFSPLELLAVVERLAGGLYGVPFRAAKRSSSEEEQLLLYARDLRHLLQIERSQRALVQRAYRETVAALASALESKDTGTRAHSQRVQRYAVELARSMDSELADDPSAEYGFLLHDVGKIGIPDKVLQKPGPLDRGRADPDADAHDPRRADARRRRAAPGCGRATSSARTTSAGTARATRTASRRTRSRSARASSRSPTRSTR